MLEQILNRIHNYFERYTVEDTFTISSGSIELDFLQEDQYFRIVGSVFNDGVYKYPADDLVDETFNGSIWALAIPPSLIKLSTEIEEWEEENSHSPYVSESFGGYSYNKGTNSQTGNPISWEDVFRSRLNHWRKII